MSEKRGYTRYNINGEITLKAENGDPIVFQVSVTDISFLGVSIHLAENVDDLIDKVILFEFTTELSSQSLSGKGKIKYAKEEKKEGDLFYRVGLEFVDVDKKALLYFLQAVQERLAVKKMKSQPFRRPGQHFGAY